jgi:hypothetical protein
MQIAAGGQMRADASPLAARAPMLPAAPGNSPPAQYPHKVKNYIENQGFAVAPALRAAQESELPGIVNGPGDAFRYILWTAELTRRFGPEAALRLLNQHETNEEHSAGWAQQAEDMDKHNNVIGIRVGQTAHDYPDALQQVQAIIAASSPDGSGSWKDPRHHLSAPAPVWLARDQWKGQQSEQSNWYDNPAHAGSLAFPQTWPHIKDYRYGGGEERYPGWFSFNTLLGLGAYLHEEPPPEHGVAVRWMPPRTPHPP